MLEPYTAGELALSAAPVFGLFWAALQYRYSTVQYSTADCPEPQAVESSETFWRWSPAMQQASKQSKYLSVCSSQQQHQAPATGQSSQPATGPASRQPGPATDRAPEIEAIMIASRGVVLEWIASSHPPRSSRTMSASPLFCSFFDYLG